MHYQWQSGGPRIFVFGGKVPLPSFVLPRSAPHSLLPLVQSPPLDEFLNYTWPQASFITFSEKIYWFLVKELTS